MNVDEPIVHAQHKTQDGLSCKRKQPFNLLPNMAMAASRRLVNIEIVSDTI